MRKEAYSVKCPQRFIFGDPLYFEEFKGEKLASLVADYSPPPEFVARIILEEKVMEDYPDLMDRTIMLYLAPEKTIQTYMDGYGYKGQVQIQQAIGVDSACYMISVDDRSNEIYTGGDGCWGHAKNFVMNITVANFWMQLSLR